MAGTGERWSLDANILIYAATSGTDPRHDLARGLVLAGIEAGARLTLQALGEFYAAVTRKGRMSRAEARHYVEDWMVLFEPIPASPASLRWAMEAPAGFSAWDAMLLAAAAEGGITAMVSEDMQDGASLGPVRVVHPFAGEALSPAMRALLG